MRRSVQTPFPGHLSPNRPAPKYIQVNQSLVHIVGIPLLIMGCIAVGGVLVILKEVLLPFVIAVFFTYLLRPIVNFLTTPFSTFCPCCTRAVSRIPPRNRYSRMGHGNREANIGISSTQLNSNQSSSGIGSLSNGPSISSSNQPNTLSASRDEEGVEIGQLPSNRRVRSVNPRANRAGHLDRQFNPVSSTSVDPPLSSSGHISVPNNIDAGHGVGLGTGSSYHPLSHHNSSALNSTLPSTSAGYLVTSGAPVPDSSSLGGIGCGRFRISRLPRWLAVLVALLFSLAVVFALGLMIVDTIQRFQAESLDSYVQQATKMAASIEAWLELLGIRLDGTAILNTLKAELLNVQFVVQVTLTLLVDGLGNALLVTLLVLYLLAETTQHSTHSLRGKVDDQVQRYIGIKTIISAAQGTVIFLILGPLLNVHMAHLFGLLHMMLNFIPTAGPVLATLIPAPIIILDPQLAASSKFLAFILPSLVHLCVGNLVEPLVFGSSMELHPVIVLLALAMWYTLWGIPGAILAVPITAVLRIAMMHLDHPYAHLITCVLEGKLSVALGDVQAALDITHGEVGSAGYLSDSDDDLELGRFEKLDQELEKMENRPLITTSDVLPVSTGPSSSSNNNVTNGNGNGGISSLKKDKQYISNLNYNHFKDSKDHHYSNPLQSTGGVSDVSSFIASNNSNPIHNTSRSTSKSSSPNHPRDLLRNDDDINLDSD